MRIDLSNSLKQQKRATRFWQTSVFVTTVAIVMLAVASFGFGIYTHRSGMVGKVGASVGVIKEQHVHLIPKIAAGLMAEPKHLSINIKFKHFQTLSAARDAAVANNALVVTGDDYVPASIDFDGELVPVKLRLKGDHIDHLQGDKWSFRIRVKGDGSLFGMKQFSLHHPMTRNYASEWLYHEALRREDVISLRYDFVNVSVNGKDLGIYALEEHFEKRLVENRRRREGPIIRFDESPAWDEYTQQGIEFPESRKNGVGSLSVAKVDSFETERWISSDETRRLHDRAVSMLETFRRGDATTSEVFDIDRLATYFALTELMGAQHGSRWINIRFYYNPITSRLEPIGFDGNAGQQIKSLCYFQRPNWTQSPELLAVFEAGLNFYELLYRDPEFVEQYLKRLKEVSTDSYLDQLMSESREDLSKHLGVIYKDFPGYRFDQEVFYRNAKYIRSVISPKRVVAAFSPPPVAGQDVSVSVSNVQGLPVTVIGVTIDDVSLAMQPTELTLSGKKPLECATYQDVSIKIPEDLQIPEKDPPILRLRAQIAGTDEIIESEIGSWSAVSDRTIRNDLVRRAANVETFEFLSRDEEKKEIRVKRGEWTIDKDMILPSGYRVRCESGTTLHLTKSALILSHSPVTFLGSEADPILVDSPDATGQGFIVFNAKGDSTLDHVMFHNLTTASRPSWGLTGAVSFHESTVFISHCKFVGASSEDALNIIRSEFSIEDSLLANTFSDALDCDFCSGEIKNSEFVECGNDGIDVSGSSVTVKNVRLRQVGDKAISIGENSSMVIDQITVNEANVAVACKDLSQLTGGGIVVNTANVGFAAFQKKPEFGGGTIRITDVELNDVKATYLIEPNSSVMIDKQQIMPNREKLKEDLY